MIFQSTFTNISIFAVSLTTKTLNSVLTHIYELNTMTSAKKTKNLHCRIDCTIIKSLISGFGCLESGGKVVVVFEFLSVMGCLFAKLPLFSWKQLKQVI